MPELPPGEADLRALSERFSEAEQRIRAPIGQAPEGDRSNLLREALLGLVVLRRRNFKDPVVRAYLHEYTGAAQTPFVTLPGPLAERLDRGLQAASEGHQERPSGGCPGALPNRTASNGLGGRVRGPHPQPLKVSSLSTGGQQFGRSARPDGAATSAMSQQQRTTPASFVGGVISKQKCHRKACDFQSTVRVIGLDRGQIVDWTRKGSGSLSDPQGGSA